MTKPGITADYNQHTAGQAHSSLLLTQVCPILSLQKIREQNNVASTPSLLILFDYYRTFFVGGHTGLLRTILMVRQEFIWQGMDEDIRHQVRSC